MRLSEFDVNEDEPGWGDLIAAFAVLVLFLIAIFLWAITFWAAS